MSTVCNCHGIVYLDCPNRNKTMVQPEDSTMKCPDCGQEQECWFAKNELFNFVIPERTGAFCANCFIRRIRRAGIITAVELSLEDFHEETMQAMAESNKCNFDRAEKAEAEARQARQEAAIENQKLRADIEANLKVARREAFAEAVKIARHTQIHPLDTPLRISIRITEAIEARAKSEQP